MAASYEQMNMFLTDMLEYNTIKVVRVRSKLLGSLHYSFMLGIALYITLHVFLSQKHYLAFESPMGLQRVTVQDPCDPLHDDHSCTFPHFSGTKAMGEMCYPPKAFRCSRHDYCKSPATPVQDIHGAVGGKLKCRYWDHNSMVWPPAERGALTIASRASLVHQELVDIHLQQNGIKKYCDSQEDMKCQWHPPISNHSAYAKQDAYMADLGNFTVRISHSMWAPSFPINGNSADMEGWLMKCKPGQDCDSDPDSWMPIKHLPKTGGADQLFMRDILYAATPADQIGVHGPGLDMDAQSDACPRKCNERSYTYRFMGLVLHANIIYDNTGTLIEGSSATNVKYWIKIMTKPSTIFHVQVVQRGSELHKRTIHHLFGPRIVFDAGGKIGALSFSHVIIQLTTSLAMFAVATTMVDFLMCYLLPRRETYYDLKYTSVEEDLQPEAADLESKDSSYQVSTDPLYPPGMDRPPGMQPKKTEEQPLLGVASSPPLGPPKGPGSGYGAGSY